MKTFVTLLCSLLCAQFLYAQNTYQTKYAIVNNSETTCLLKAKDSGSTVILWQPAQCNAPTGCPAYISAHHFNNKGALLWSKDYKTDSSFSRPQATETPDGGFVFFGQLSGTGDDSYRGIAIVKCDKNGDIVWSKRIQSSIFPVLTPQLTAVGGEGNLLLCYTVSDVPYGSADLSVVKISAAGSIAWNTTVTLGIRGDDLSVNSFTRKGNKYYFVCNKNCGECEGYVTDAILVTANATTGAITAKNFDTDFPDQTFRPMYADKLFSSGNTFYLKGSYFLNSRETHSFIAPFTDTTTSVMATILADEMDITFQYQLRKYKGVFPFRYGPGSYFDKDGSLNTLGYETGYNVLQRFDPLGRICPDMIIPDVDTSTSEKLFSISAWKPAVTKEKLTVSDKTVTVSAGMLPLGRGCYVPVFSGEKEESGQISSLAAKAKQAFIFPNPASDVVHLTGLTGRGTHIAILSSAGTIIRSYTFYDSVADIPVAYLANGLYFIRFMEKGQAPYSIPFVKESR